MKTNKERIYGLDAMRTFASILVLASHGALLFPGYNNILTDSLQIIGVFGVEMFFILSGFLIGGILINLLETTQFNFLTLKYFWFRRWFRTIPLYFLMLIINILIVLTFSGELPNQLWKYFFFLQNFVDSQSFLFSESWSLTIEEYSYLLAPLLILVCSAFIKKRSKIFLTATLIAIVFFIAVKTSYYVKNLDLIENLIVWNANLKGVLIYRLDTIFYGFLAAYIFKYHNSVFKNSRKLFLIVGIVLFGSIYGLMVFSKFQMNGFKLFWNVAYLPLNSLAIAFCMPFIYYLPKPNQIIKNWVEKVSIYSYSIYLIHYSVVITLILKLLPVASFSLSQKVCLAFMYLVVTYFLSSISYRYFEKPMMDLRDKPIFKNKKISNS